MAVYEIAVPASPPGTATDNMSTANTRKCSPPKTAARCLRSCERLRNLASQPKLLTLTQLQGRNPKPFFASGRFTICGSISSVLRR